MRKDWVLEDGTVIPADLWGYGRCPKCFKRIRYVLAVRDARQIYRQRDVEILPGMSIPLLAKIEPVGGQPLGFPSLYKDFEHDQHDCGQPTTRTGWVLRMVTGA